MRNGLIAAHRNGALYLMRGDGSGLRKVPGRGWPAVWTPDRKWLAFSTYTPIETPEVDWIRLDFWLMRPDGSHRHLVARNVPLGAFSPDGKTMAFENDSCAPAYAGACARLEYNTQELYTIGVDGRGLRRLTQNRGYDGRPSWSPDGKRIAYATDSGVRVMDRDGRNSHQLFNGTWDNNPLWSPRGNDILISTRLGRAIIPADGGKPKYLKRGPRGPEWGGAATWSPDGRRIVYLFKRARRWTVHDPLQIWVMNADGTGRHPIAKTLGWSVPSWAPAS